MAEELSTAFTELLTTSRDKFSQAYQRLRRDEAELALLSLHGAIEDALRAHLLRGRDPAARAVWGQMVEAMRSDARQPLSTLEYERLLRLHTLRGKIARGERVALAPDTIDNYYQLAQALLPRYGVQVVAEERPTARQSGRSERPDPRRATPADVDEAEVIAGFERFRGLILPLILILSIFLIGASLAIALQGGGLPQSNSPQSTNAPLLSATDVAIPTLPAATLGPSPAIALPTASPSAVPPGQIAPGRTAIVAASAELGLALRAQPGTEATIPIITYLEPGTQVQVIDGPVAANGFTWWRVRVVNDEGWCAGEFLLVP